MSKEPGLEKIIVFDKLLYKKRREQFEHILKVYKHWEVKDQEILSVIYGYYAGRLVQCVQEIAISDASDKKFMIKEILQDKLNSKALRYGKINSRMLSIAAVPMRMKWMGGCIITGKFIGGVKEKMPALFFKLKSTSVNKGIAEKG